MNMATGVTRTRIMDGITEEGIITTKIEMIEDEKNLWMSIKVIATCIKIITMMSLIHLPNIKAETQKSLKIIKNLMKMSNVIHVVSMVIWQKIVHKQSVMYVVKQGILQGIVRTTSEYIILDIYML